MVGYGADLNVQDHELATPLHIVTHVTGNRANQFPLGLGLGGSETPDFLKVSVIPCSWYVLFKINITQGHLPLPGIDPLGLLHGVANFVISDKTPHLSKVC